MKKTCLRFLTGRLLLFWAIMAIGMEIFKILPPVIVGFHGDPVKFVQEQVKLDESNGVPVEPQSLYEAQLERRLGSVPAWLKALK